MIEVIGKDGRVHSFAEGTTQAQIDAALAAMYDAPQEPPAAPVEPPPATPHSAAPPPVTQQAPPPYVAAPPYPVSEPPRGISTAQILGGVLAAVVLAGLVTFAFVMGRGGLTTPAAQKGEAVARVEEKAIDPATNGVGTPVEGTLAQEPVVTAEAFSGFIATPQGGNVIVRAVASTTGFEIAKLPHGAPVSVTGSILAADGLWREVSVGGATGYVKGDYVSQTQPAPVAKAATPVVTSSGGGFRANASWGTVVTRSSSTVNMRASPSISSRVISSLPYGADVWVVGRQGNWYLVEWGNKRGWANVDYILRDDRD